ncbi:MAG TPA: hypothetical protein VIK18_23505 [Pirellulales bacterium]
MAACWIVVVCWTVFTFCAGAAWAGDVITKPAPTRASDAKYQSVELFAGIESGKLEAKLIPRDSRKARIFVTNKTAEPLNVRLPAAFAGQPVLAQFLAPGGGGNNQSNQGGVNQNNVPQTIGGSTTRGNGTGPGGGPPGFFNVPPERTAEFRVDCVCLEYGKPNPRPLVNYQLVPADKVANPETVAMLTEFGRDKKYSQRAAQAAAWHLANAMSWEKLADIRGELISIGVRERYFTREQLDDAHKLVDAARASARANPATIKPQPAKPEPAVVSPGTQAAR